MEDPIECAANTVSVSPVSKLAARLQRRQLLSESYSPADPANMSGEVMPDTSVASLTSV